MQVVDVVKEQLNMVFKSEKKISNTEDFKVALKAVPFSKIQEQRLKSLEKDSLPIIVRYISILSNVLFTV